MSRFRDIVEKILLEAKQVGLLYHATTLQSLIKILDTNTLKSSLESGISFTRNKNFTYNNNPFILIFDGDKLSEHHKLQPFDYSPFSQGQVKNHSEYETSLYPSKRSKPDFISKLNTGNKDLNLLDDEDKYELTNIHKYLVGLILNKNFLNSKDWDSLKNMTNQKYLQSPKDVLEFGQEIFKKVYPNLPITTN